MGVSNKFSTKDLRQKQNWPQIGKLASNDWLQVLSLADSEPERFLVVLLDHSHSDKLSTAHQRAKPQTFRSRQNLTGQRGILRAQVRTLGNRASVATLLG